MEIRLGALRKKDHKQAIQFARQGMHFDWYTDSPLLLRLYGRYFWCLEYGRASQAIAAYHGDALAGVLLAEMRGEAKPWRSLAKRLYIRLFELSQGLLFRGGTDAYAQANREMFARYCQTHTPDGEITFLAVDPRLEGRGIGTLLLNELARRESGKQLYLYTDSGCTYQFYERRGFTRAGEKDIVMELGGKRVNLKCLLYSKTLENR